MRKTPHNPRGFERNSWNWRCLQLRHALGWTQKKLARVMKTSPSVIYRLETGMLVRPAIETVFKIKRMEQEYADILKAYKASPVRMDRLKHQEWGKVRLLPIEIRRPEDLQSLGKVEADSTPLFFGRSTRRKMSQIGLSVREKEREARRRKNIAQTMRRKTAEGRGNLPSLRKPQS